jgi:hypothetical protein
VTTTRLPMRTSVHTGRGVGASKRGPRGARDLGDARSVALWGAMGTGILFRTDVASRLLSAFAALS